MGLALPGVRAIATGASSVSGGAGTATTNTTPKVGDLILAFDGITGGTATPAAPTVGSWTQIGVASDVAAGELAGWAKRVTADGAQAVTFAGISSRRHGVIVLVLSKAAFPPAEAFSESGDTDPSGGILLAPTRIRYKVVCPSAITDSNKNKIIRVAMPYSSGAWDDPSNDTQISVNGLIMRMALQDQNSAGSVGTKTFYHTVSGVDYNAMTVAIEGSSVTTFQEVDAVDTITVSSPPLRGRVVFQEQDAVDTIEVTGDAVANRRPPQTFQETAFDVIQVTSWARPTPQEITAMRARQRRRAVTSFPLSGRIRVMAQRFTGEWMKRDLPIHDLEVERVLNGGGNLRGFLSPTYRDLMWNDGYKLLEPWGTWLHLEVRNQIWGSYIVTEPAELSNQELTVDAIGFGGYPYDMDFLGTISLENFDPGVIQKLIWEHLEDVNGHPLNVTVEDLITGQVWGRPKVKEDGTSEPDPYQIMPWEFKDSGQEIDNVVKAVPYDWVERTAWNSDKSEVNRWIARAYPKFGRRRDDLDFIEGQNIVEVVSVGEQDGQYASDIAGVGKGEGAESIYAVTSTVHPIRTRRLKTITDKVVDNEQQMNSIIRDAAAKSKPIPRIKSIVVNVNARGAPYGSWDLGDEISIKTRDYRTGLRHRIISDKIKRDSDLVEIEVLPSGLFTYGVSTL
jgi:hypothetical protein